MLVDKTDFRTYITSNPATGEVIKEINGVKGDEASLLLKRAHAAFRLWKDAPISERVAVLDRIADGIDRRSEALARQISTEMGKIYAHSIAEIRNSEAIFRMYARESEQWLAEEELPAGRFTRLWVQREPLGVTLAIEPWNSPIYQAARVAAPNIALGNALLLKPANNSAGSTLMLDEIFASAGLPEDVYKTALLAPDQVSNLIADPRVRAVTLTGSDRVGEIIGSQAGKNLKPVVLELGGSDPFIVLEDADIELAAKTFVERRLYISGQVCASPKRVIAIESVVDELTELIAEAFKNQVLGDPLAPDTTVGPLSSARAAEDLQALYDDAVAKGANVIVEGGRVSGTHAYFAPAVLSGVTPDMRLYSEEAFGPIAVIYAVSNVDAAIKLANDTPYGLSGNVFSRNMNEAYRIAKELDSGGVGINDWIGAPIQAPFGGTKSSGVGREHAREGIDSFANIKTYSVT